MPRGPDTPYLDPTALVENYEARSTPLDGVRRFYAREGLVVFADDKNGMKSLGGEVWLRPSACRRIGSFLDLQRPAVVGFQLRRDPVAPPLAATLGADLYAEFVQAAAGTCHMPFEGQAQLVSAVEQTGDAWPWRGSVSYEYVQRLARGQRVTGQTEVDLCARQASDGTVDVAVMLNRQPQDLYFATRWLRWAFAQENRGWTVDPVTLPEDVSARLNIIRGVLARLDDGSEAPVASPGFHRLPPLMTEVADTEGDDGPSEGFLSVLRSSTYQTDMTSVDVIAERMGVDKAAISVITTYLTRREQASIGRGHEDVVVALRLRQTPRRDVHFQLAWHAAKVPSADDELTRENWDNWSSLPWDHDRKRAFLLDTWTNVVDSVARRTQTPQRATRGRSAASA